MSVLVPRRQLFIACFIWWVHCKDFVIFYIVKIDNYLIHQLLQRERTKKKDTRSLFLLKKRLHMEPEMCAKIAAREYSVIVFVSLCRKVDSHLLHYAVILDLAYNLIKRVPRADLELLNNKTKESVYFSI